ncbi:hypothetical protein JKF63_02900 [Porcisia hertigi]|uniref:Uncharacterized protein n=1 Tax=Porcisia hertigi TaxID=2761500 RepID=A0A836HT22_9TRYP|nr:hypothetical protein JKF63_02900 [Porcisia hertigi]
MLRFACVNLGRWSSRDFLRGRSKRAGAVHTRHTHGRQGRYKRLSSITSSIRDGRRHASNHIQGGLGLKLGGGLFGLRIPRQHQLSHMSKEEFELEVYGHPNITNPYREHVGEHPDLKSVMMNATVALRLVVLLPKVARGPAQREGDDVQVPEQWSSVVREVKTALSALSASGHQALGAVEVHLATLETSVRCHCPLGDMALTPPADGGKERGAGPDLEMGLAQLYRTHSWLGNQLKPLTEVTPRHQRRPAAFMGVALRAPLSKSSSTSSGCFASPASSTSFTSSVLASLTGGDHAPPPRILHTTTSEATHIPSLSPIQARSVASDTLDAKGKGIIGLVRECSATEQPLLRLCLRPGAPASSAMHPTMGNSRAATSAVAAAAPIVTRKVLKEDIDFNGEAGVWRLDRSPLPELLRWHYCAQDPRAHNHDALPHHRRPLPVLLVVDCSTTPRGTDHAKTRGTTSPKPVATLMPRRFSLELESAGFRLLAESSLLEVAKSLEAWMPARQWEDYVQSCAHGYRQGSRKCDPAPQMASP